MHPNHEINIETGKSVELEHLLVQLETDDPARQAQEVQMSRSPKCPFGRSSSGDPMSAEQREKLRVEIEALLFSPFDEYKYDSDFAIQVREEVVEFFEDRGLSMYADRFYWLKLAFITLLSISLEVVYLFYPSYWLAIIIGLVHAGVGLNITHDASHGAISKQPWINKFWQISADWTGNNRYMWYMQHVVRHHTYSNDEGRDTDATSGEPLVTFAINGRGWIQNNFQGFYQWLVLSWYWVSVVVRVFNEDFWNSGSLSIFLRFLYFYRFFVHPMIMTGSVVHGFFMGLMVPLFCGVWLANIFCLSHNFLGSFRGDLLKGADWYRHQVITTSSYGGKMSGIITGGLNFQVTHHLFPKICSVHYWRLQPIVERLCLEHGLNYTHFPWIHQNFIDTAIYMGVPLWMSKRSPRPLKAQKKLKRG